MNLRRYKCLNANQANHRKLKHLVPLLHKFFLMLALYNKQNRTLIKISYLRLMILKRLRSNNRKTNQPRKMKN